MKRKNNNIIFLTGCINPNGMAFTALQDPDIRREQYIATIKFYLQHTDKRILFVENSNNDISAWFENEIHNHDVEIITFDGNNYDKLLGKGYGEMLIIEYALAHSVFIREADFIFKITGRLQVLNIKAICRQIDKDETIQILMNFQQNLSYADSKCWGAAKSFYSDILILNKNIIDDSKGIHFEHALSKAAHLAIAKGYNFQFIADLPRYSGIKGSENKKFNDSVLYWIPLYIKHKMRLNMLRK
jgi:hypothetical protein